MAEQEKRKLMGNQLNNTMPEKIRIVLKNGIPINKEGIPSFLLGKIGNIVSFSNPQFLQSTGEEIFNTLKFLVG